MRVTISVASPSIETVACPIRPMVSERPEEVSQEFRQLAREIFQAIPRQCNIQDLKSRIRVFQERFSEKNIYLRDLANAVELLDLTRRGILKDRYFYKRFLAPLLSLSPQIDSRSSIEVPDDSEDSSIGTASEWDLNSLDDDEGVSNEPSDDQKKIDRLKELLCDADPADSCHVMRIGKAMAWLGRISEEGKQKLQGSINLLDAAWNCFYRYWEILIAYSGTYHLYRLSDERLPKNGFSNDLKWVCQRTARELDDAASLWATAQALLQQKTFNP